MDKYDISAKRLHTFDIKNWSSSYFTSQELADADFYKKRSLIRCSNCRVSFHSFVLKLYKPYHNLDCSLVEEIKLEAELTRLQPHIQAKAEILAIELIKQKKAQLVEQKIQEQAQRDAELTKCQTKWEAKKRAELIEQAQQEAQLSRSTSKDIDIFDSTLVCDILEFDLYSKVVEFLQHLQQIQNQGLYQEQDVLDLLPKCVRGSAFAWFKDQIFIIIQDFDRDLACAFSTTSLESTSKSSTSHVSHSSSQYHLCVECFAQFSSMTRLLEHTKQVNCSKVVCKHCEQEFNFKNKLHEHIREHHISKSITSSISSITSKNSNLRSTTPESMYKIKKKPEVCPSASLAPSTLSATSKSISCSASIPESVSSKSSHLPIATLDITPKQAEIAAMLATRGFTPKRAEIAAFNCPLAPPTPPATPTSISEPVSPKCSSLPIATHKTTPKSMEKLPASCSLTPPASPPRTPPRTPLSKHQKPYLTIGDLIRMFRGKPRPFDLHSHQKRRPSPRSPGTFYQSRITAYFLPAANQKAPISQGLKSPNPKSFQQHTPAESIPPCRPALPEKSAFSPYKKPGISYTSLQSRSSFLQSRSSSAWPTSPPTSPPSFRSPTPDHVCCTCFGHSSFRNGLFNYPRPSQRYPSNRRPMRGGRDG